MTTEELVGYRVRRGERQMPDPSLGGPSGGTSARDVPGAVSVAAVLAIDSAGTKITLQATTQARIAVVAYAASHCRTTWQIVWVEPRSTSSHYGSLKALDQRVPELPSTADDAGKVGFSSDEAVAGWFSARLVVPQAAAAAAAAVAGGAPVATSAAPDRSSITLVRLSNPLLPTRIRARRIGSPEGLK